MRTILAIYRRELRAAFHNPGVYVVAGLFFFLVSAMVIHGIIDYSARSTGSVQIAPGERPLGYTQTLTNAGFGAVSILFVFLVPILTMRSFAEEKRSGVVELLVTWPVKDWQWILGKFFSLATVLLVIDALMGVYVTLFYLLGEPETGVIVSAFLGLVLISLAYAAFGLFASALTENQVIAAVIAFAGLFFFWIIQSLGGGGTTLFSRVCDNLSISSHFVRFVEGGVGATDIAYFILFTLWWLFVTARVLESRRWRT